jgi:2-octaprenyl-6-methoxyphenol hydroxylase
VRRDYHQQAIVAAVKRASRRTASPTNASRRAVPVALLPLGKHFALVWTAPDSEAAALLALDDVPSCRAFTTSSPAGSISPRRPARNLSRLDCATASTPVAERAVWLGNAAQTLHPVAGQGFNLALRDVSQLADLLQDHGRPIAAGCRCWRAMLQRGGSIGAAPSASPMAWSACLACAGALASHARGAGLLALDLLPAARRFLRAAHDLRRQGLVNPRINCGHRRFTTVDAGGL